MSRDDHASPWEPSSGCRAARDAYLRENGWTLDAYDAPKTLASFLGIKIAVPNTPKHRWAIRLHDLHHVATGFGTDATGEAEVSAWELARGLGGLDLYVASLVVMGALYGVLRAPVRTWHALRAAGTRNLFDVPPDEASYEALLALDVAALRARLGLPPGGVARYPRKLHAHAPREGTLTTSSRRTESVARSS